MFYTCYLEVMTTYHTSQPLTVPAKFCFRMFLFRVYHTFDSNNDAWFCPRNLIAYHSSFVYKRRIYRGSTKSVTLLRNDGHAVFPAQNGSLIWTQFVPIHCRNTIFHQYSCISMNLISSKDFSMQMVATPVILEICVTVTVAGRRGQRIPIEGVSAWHWSRRAS